MKKSITTKLAKQIISQESGWERTTIILNAVDYQKLKSIAQLKGLEIKDVVNDLIKVYNKNAITKKDSQNIEKEKARLESEIKKLVDIQQSNQESTTDEVQ